MAHTARSDAAAFVSSCASAPAPTFGELQISIYPRESIKWRGSRAELEAEGLLPAGFVWPEGDAPARWQTDRYSFWLMRTAPERSRGAARKAWRTQGDHWFLNRVLLAAEPLARFDDARIHEARQNLQRAVWAATPAAELQRFRAIAARDDKGFQVLMSTVTGRRLQARHASTAKGARNV